MTELTEHALRAEVRDWVKGHWDPAMPLRAWRELLVGAGWAVPSWPERWYGKGLPALSNVARHAHKVHSLIAGAGGMLAGSESPSPLHGTVAEILISVPGQSIAGGTDEIQKNIVGERFLGLPREPDPAKGRPYRKARNR